LAAYVESLPPTTPTKRRGGLTVTRASFRQVEIERVLRAANKAGSIVQMDMKTLIATIIPAAGEKLVDADGNPLGILPSGNLAQDGKENWDED
jgi:hypothetical protein